MFSASLVVNEHAIAVFHREYFVVDASVVAVLVAQVVELLAQFRDKLVFVGTPDFDSCFLEG
jgi:hypothetical protein